MMSYARYIVRLDDAHPGMLQKSWDKIESILDFYQIKPIVGVIPENKDSTIMYRAAPKNDNFWERANRWQSKGWHLAVHGLNHKLRRSSSSGFFPINNFSEFVGRSFDEQSEMIIRAIDIFETHGLDPEIWMSPAHGMDMNTVRSLIMKTNIRTITDGLSFRPYKKYGLNWIPQQLWKGRLMPFGTWTICLHPSSMNFEEISLFGKYIECRS